MRLRSATSSPRASDGVIVWAAVKDALDAIMDAALAVAPRSSPEARPFPSWGPCVSTSALGLRSIPTQDRASEAGHVFWSVLRHRARPGTHADEFSD